MKKPRTVLLTLAAFVLAFALMIDLPVQATCCMGSRLSGPCGGDGVYRIMSSDPGMTMAQCKTDTMDYYGMVFSCVSLYLDSTSPPCY